MMYINYAKTLLVGILVFLYAFNASVAKEGVMYPGEELVYELSFLGIGLGEIKMITEESVDLNGKKLYKTKAMLNTYKGIPYVDLHAVFESWIDPSVSYSHQFVGNTKKEEGKWEYYKVSFNYKENMIETKKWMNKKITKELSIPIKKKYNDGASLYYLARRYLRMKRTAQVPTLIEDKLCNTKINFQGKKENVEIDAVDYPIKTIYLDGKAEWEGLYGLKGIFEGWFSDDDAQIAILAHMNVYVGKAKIELVKWKRGNWQPPRADEKK